jgi:hypothetical protein
MLSTGRAHRWTRWASSPRRRPSGRPWHRRGGLPDRRHQGDRRGASGRHHHPRRPARPQAARLQGDAPAGLRRALSGGLRRLRGPARRPAQAAAERRRPVLRARGLPGPGLRLPLRLPRHAPHGDRPGAPGAGVRPRPDHHRPHGGLRGGLQRRRGDQPHRQPGGPAGAATRSARSASPSSRPTSWCPRTTWARSSICASRSAGCRSTSSISAGRCRSSYELPLRRWCSTSSTAQVREPRLRLLRVRASSASRPRTWSSSTC